MDNNTITLKDLKPGELVLFKERVDLVLSVGEMTAVLYKAGIVESNEKFLWLAAMDDFAKRTPSQHIKPWDLFFDSETEQVFEIERMNQVSFQKKGGAPNDVITGIEVVIFLKGIDGSSEVIRKLTAIEDVRIIPRTILG